MIMYCAPPSLSVCLSVNVYVVTVSRSVSSVCSSGLEGGLDFNSTSVLFFFNIISLS